MSVTVVPVAIVTGATRGIGRAIVQKLSHEGMSCVCIGSTRGSIESINASDQFQFVSHVQRHQSLAIDLSQWPGWLGDETKGVRVYDGIDYINQDKMIKGRKVPLFDYTKWHMEGPQADPGVRYSLRLLVNCAGISQSSLSVRTPVGRVQEIMNLNFMSCVSLSNLATKQMLREKRWVRECGATSVLTAPGPCVINVSSKLGEPANVVPGTSTYAASKAALSQYTRVLAQETAVWGIRALEVAPGLVRDTDMVRDLDPAAREQLVESLLGIEADTTPQAVAAEVWQRYSGSLM